MCRLGSLNLLNLPTIHLRMQNRKKNHFVHPHHILGLGDTRELVLPSSLTLDFCHLNSMQMRGCNAELHGADNCEMLAIFMINDAHKNHLSSNCE